MNTFLYYFKRYGLMLIALTLMLTLFQGSSVQAQGTVSFAYIANANDGTVSVIDTSTNSVVATVQVGSSPKGVAVNPAGTRVYVANAGSSNVSVIDTSTNSVIATVAIGSLPFAVAVNPTGTRVYVTNNSDHVSVIDTSNNSVMTTVTVGNEPAGVAVKPDGTRGYVVNGGSDNVSVIDLNSNSVVATVKVGNFPEGVAVNPAGTRVYVANWYSNNVSVIDTSTNSVMATVAVGINPTGVAVKPDGTRVYVTNWDSKSVSVIDTSTNSVVATVTVETNPKGVAVNLDGTRVYVTNYSSHSVSVIATNSNSVVATVQVGNGPYSLGQFIGPGTTTMQADLVITYVLTSTQLPNGSSCYTNPPGLLLIRVAYVTVANQGMANAGAFVVSFGGQSQIISSLQAGQSTTITLSGINDSPVPPAVDINNQVAESNESNNSYMDIIYGVTATPPPTCTPTLTPTPTTPMPIASPMVFLPVVVRQPTPTPTFTPTPTPIFTPTPSLVHLFVSSVKIGRNGTAEVWTVDKRQLLLRCSLIDNTQTDCGYFKAVGSYKFIANTICGIKEQEFSDAVAGKEITREVRCN